MGGLLHLFIAPSRHQFDYERKNICFFIITSRSVVLCIRKIRDWRRIAVLSFCAVLPKGITAQRLPDNRQVNCARSANSDDGTNSVFQNKWNSFYHNFTVYHKQNNERKKPLVIPSGTASGLFYSIL